jgi:hypothetical protein
MSVALPPLPLRRHGPHSNTFYFTVLLHAASNFNKASYVIHFLENVSTGIRQEHVTGVPMEINFPPPPPPSSLTVK